MTTSTESHLPAAEPESVAVVATVVDRRLSQMATLVERLDPTRGVSESAREISSGDASLQAAENNLVQARLGMASSLFLALRAKHPPTASHSLRVALGCSAWAAALQMPAEERDAIEVAALLHDVGKIGVPDGVLLKPGRLSPEETVLMDRYRAMTTEILAACCATPRVLDMVRHASSWYDGSRQAIQSGGQAGGPNAVPGSGLAGNLSGNPISGEQLPLGARLIAIMDAFDAMTCGQVHRPALAHERAVQELFRFAGTQFDPRLVGCFRELGDRDLAGLRERLASDWLRRLEPAAADAGWQLAPVPIATDTDATHTAAALPTDALFPQKLLANMTDAVMFLDGDFQVLFWNRGAERLTGIEAAAVERHHYSPTLLKMRNEWGERFADGECPAALALRTGAASISRLMIQGRNDRNMNIDAQVIPVATADGTLHGLALVMHDASPEASLEQRCQRLHEKAIRDPLTQLANRAEFDRVQGMFIEAHARRGLPCSLIICDIDHFKKVNDTFGHPAGDEALRSFAKLLKASCRSGDLVARYGGEEFVMLCADCTLAIAFERADQIRRNFAAMTHPVLEGQSISASFGVTETQAGDTPATMLHRADRALLAAKAGGRNMVVQLGNGEREEKREPRGRWWRFWQGTPSPAILEHNLVTAVPFNVAIEKLRGFVADHEAQVDAIEDSQIRMSIHREPTSQTRRSSDRAVSLLVELNFAEEQIRGVNSTGLPAGILTRTKIKVVVRPKHTRDRRQADTAPRARRLLASLRSYLMATDDPGTAGQEVLRRTTHMLVPWLTKQQDGR